MLLASNPIVIWYLDELNYVAQHRVSSFSYFDYSSKLCLREVMYAVTFHVTQFRVLVVH